MADPGLRLLEALDDEAAFDRAMRALPSFDRLLPTVLQSVDGEERARLEAALPRTSEDVGAGFRVSALARQGRPALWVASAWILEHVPGRERRAPSPTHERWDALVEIHKDRPEAAWLVAELFARLTDPTQHALGRRVLLGVRRRFGERGAEVLTARALDGVPLSPLLAAWL